MKRKASRQRLEKRDPNLETIERLWPGIILLHEDFKGEKPVLELDVQKGKVSAYPYEDYKHSLTSQSQALLEKQYAAAPKKELLVIFVKDVKRGQLACYSFEC